MTSRAGVLEAIISVDGAKMARGHRASKMKKCGRVLEGNLDSKPIRSFRPFRHHSIPPVRASP